MRRPAHHERLEDIEIALLLEGVFRRYGYDFRDYDVSALKQRILDRVIAEDLRTVSGLEEKVLHDPACLERLVLGLSAGGGVLFHEPDFYRAFRMEVVPLLRTYPSVRIWQVGCSTGEGVYSLAMVLHEEGLAERARIYATDVSEMVLEQARAGSFPLAALDDAHDRYVEAGGQRELSEYYNADGDSFTFAPWLKKNLLFAQHNLATDGPFNQFHAIICRDVLTAFKPALQERAHQLFLASLIRYGFLCLGSQESTKHTPSEAEYEDFDPDVRIFRRIR